MPNPNNPLDGFAELRAAARKIDRHPDTLRKRISRGELQAYRSGRTVYIKLADLVPKPVPGPKRRANGK